MKTCGMFNPASRLRSHHASQGAFLHRDWLTTYTETVPPAVLEYVDAHRNCEDIAMAFLVANATGSPPVYVRAPGLQDLGQGVRKVWGSARQCLQL